MVDPSFPGVSHIGDRLTTIDAPFGIAGTSHANGINPEGAVVGTYLDHGTVVGGDALRTRSYLQDSAGNFTPIDFPDAENTLAIKITPTGQAVGCYHHQGRDFAVSGGGTMHGYVYQNGNYESLSVPGTMHNGITRDGRIIVGAVFPTPSEFHAYKVQDGVYELLNLPDYVLLSDARDVSPEGSIVGFFVDSSHKTHGFLLTDKGFTAIDYPGALATQAFGINPEGHIVGLFVDSSNKTHGFLLAGDSFTPIDVSGAAATRAFGINPEGDIVGGYVDSNGKSHGFLLSMGN